MLAEFSRPKSRRPPVFVSEIVTSFVPVDEVNEAFVRACVLVNAPLAANVVKLPAAAVVAPTVPLMLIEAVPVRFVTVPEAGVPRIAPLPSVATPVTPSVLLTVIAPVIETVVPLSCIILLPNAVAEVNLEIYPEVPVPVTIELPIKKPLIISTLAVVEPVAIITGLEILLTAEGSTDTAEPATVSDKKYTLLSTKPVSPVIGPEYIIVKVVALAV